MSKRIIISLLIISLLGGLCSFFIYQDYSYKERLKEQRRDKLLTQQIKEHYNNYVITRKKAYLYVKKKKKYFSIGQVASATKLELEKTIITKTTKYFLIKNLHYYIHYQDVVKTLPYTKDTRYHNYLPYNENIITKKTKLYQNNRLIYSLNITLDAPIIIKDDPKYYIAYNDELYYTLKDSIAKTYSKENTTASKSTAIPVTVYHFIYLNGDTGCKENICFSEDQIKEEFQYLKDNDFFTLTTKELDYFIDGKINLPAKSILITIDDGARATNFIPILEKYKVNATLFLITSWYDKNTLQSSYLELASHTNDLHRPGNCPGGRGSPLRCWDKAKLLADLVKSRAYLNNTEAFCFPFYDYNDYAISIVKEAGFKMAFIGGGRKVTAGIDKFQIPRIPLSAKTSLESYKKIVD